MLTQLTIKNVVLIDALTIEAETGLLALTGETGAGKSILLDSLGLALGARSDSGLIRKGSDQASVSAEFFLPENHPSLDVLQDQGLDYDRTLILRRVIATDGRSRAFINDQPVSISLLKTIGDHLVEIHGQFETQGLLNPQTHLDILDSYAQVAEQKAVLVKCWQDWQTAQAELGNAEQNLAKAREEEAFLRQSVEDLDGLAPEPGEEDELAAQRAMLMNREQVVEAYTTAYNALSAEGGAENAVHQALKALDRVADKAGPKAGALIAAVEGLAAQIQEAVSDISSLFDDMERSGHSLEDIDDRLHALRDQARKHDCTVDDLPAMRDQLAGRLSMIENQDDYLDELLRKVKKARSAYIEQADIVREKRRSVAGNLDQLVAQELIPLKLDKARFVTDVSPLAENDWGPAGMDKIRFMVATNPGADPGPLNKIASGGELARFMLALKVVLAESGTIPVMVFDEVDSGVGGAVADAVGERLGALAKTHQVLVVTHSPQVAARASYHYIVAKAANDDGDMTTQVIPLRASEERREEIARMLSGADVTVEARAAADKLLEPVLQKTGS